MASTGLLSTSWRDIRVELDGAPNATLACRYAPPSKDMPMLVVFLNGLLLAQDGWKRVVEQLGLEQRRPAMLTYDRYGQHDSSPDPRDSIRDREPGHRHDLNDARDDLDQLLHHIITRYVLPDLDAQFAPDNVTLILVANSLGCALARHFAAHFPGRVLGMLLLDSIIANSDQTSLFPDPHSDGFSRDKLLPPGVTFEEYCAARCRWGELFHPDVTNPEGLSRRNLAELLPDADKPKLPGVHVIVVGHDPDVFAKRTEEGRLKIPQIMTNTWVNPAWHHYNQGLTTLSECSRGPLIAQGCGHFIQDDNPDLVVRLAVELVTEVTKKAPIKPLQ